MPFNSEGTLKTDKREVAESETWESQTDWEAYQSVSSVEINNGVLTLSESTLPDEEDVLAWYDFSEEDGSLPVTDKSGNGYDLSGDYSGVSQSINGVQAGYFDGTDDFISSTFTAVPQPNQVFIVAKFDVVTNGQNDIDLFDSEANDATQLLGQANSGQNWRIYAGDSVVGGSEDTDIHVFNGFYNTSNSVLRIDSTEIATGNVGNSDLNGISLGGGRQDYFEGLVGEVIVYPEDKTSIQSDVESYLADKWGITL